MHRYCQIILAQFNKKGLIYAFLSKNTKAFFLSIKPEKRQISLTNYFF